MKKKEDPVFGLTRDEALDAYDEIAREFIRRVDAGESSVDHDLRSPQARAGAEAVIILAIDPGTDRSAFLLYRPSDRSVQHAEIRHNEFLLSVLRGKPAEPMTVVCEMVQSYGSGLAVGKETFETVRWIGRFQEAVEAREGRFEILYRPAIKAHLCGSAKAKDGNVRQALIDRFGGDSVALKGKKCPKCKGAAALGERICEPCASTGWLRKPGPLAGITSHMWAALAVAVTWAETQKEKP